MSKSDWDVIVIGGGAAGLSAALTLGRARRRTLVVDAGEPRNRFAAHMHGVLGMEGVSPAELLRRGREEVASYGVEVRDGRVREVKDAERGLDLTLEDGTALHTRALVVATGLSDDLPDIPRLAERWGISVLHCPYCHGREVADRPIGVLTTSPMGLHQGLLLRQWTEDLTVFTAGIGELSEEDAARLRSRGVRLVDSPVVEVLGEGTDISGVRLADGGTVEVEAIFTAATLRPHDDFLSGLDLARQDTPMGSFLAVDGSGQTGHGRIWAVGNVANPGANVPVSMGSASWTAGMVNMFLVQEDFDLAAGPQEPQEPAAFWEGLYAGRPRWSGRVNATLADLTAALPPGRALDLGSGEGADVLWLSERGWDATGIDLSPTAVARAQEAADAAEVSGSARFAAADLADLDDEGPYDLVTASFFHSPVELPRTEILRRAASLVSPGGHLLLVTHAAAPPWAPTDAHDHHFASPQEDLADLALSEDEWETVLCETRDRPATGPDGTAATLIDGVVMLRRR